MLKCSFDFDGTLDRKPVQIYAKELISRGIEVHIVTSRFGDQKMYETFFHCTTDLDIMNSDLWEVAKELSIPKERVHFTNMSDKWNYLKDKDFLWHLDDDWAENKLINNKTKTKGIDSFGNPKWKGKCQKILKKWGE